MAWFTTTVKTICEQTWLDKNPAKDKYDIPYDPNVVIQAVVNSVIPPNYPIWEGGSKEDLSSAILRHYYMREIGLETVALWRYYVGMRLNEIMPYYIQLFDSQLDYDKIFDTEDREVLRGRKQTDQEEVGQTTSERYNESQRKDDESIQGHEQTSARKTDETRHDESSGESSGKTLSNTNTLSDTTGTTHTDSNSKDSVVKKFADTPQNKLEDVALSKYLTNVSMDSGEKSGTDNTVSDTHTKSSQMADSSSTNNSSYNDDYNSTIDTTDNMSANTRQNITSNLTRGTERGEESKINRNKSEDEKENVRYKGFVGNRVEFTMMYRDAILNITQMIIDEMADLFIGIL